MLTDWVLIGRLGFELDERLRGSRLEEAGYLADGRVALALRRRGARLLLAIDLFASPPLATVEDGELTLLESPGFVRVLTHSLRGMTVTGVAARRDDRLLRLSFGARSRFGVGEQVDLYAELVPRFGNLVLVKGETVVGALKEFSLGENHRRAVQTGAPYALPPLPPQIRVLVPGAQPAGIDRAEPLHVYRRDGLLQQVYVVPLPGFEDAEHTREESLLALLSELRVAQQARAENEASRRRRDAIAKRLAQREQKFRAEQASIHSKRARAEERDELRAQGEEIYATLHELAEDERDEAKERATKLFGEYKKLGKSLPHLATRERGIAASLEAIETLRWELERVGDEDVADVDAAVAELDTRPRSKPHAVARKRKRPRLEFRTERGSRIVVGRSPIENAELTFQLARPNDLWFHAQGIPGAHVLVSRDDRAAVPDQDLETAAALAAYYSKARASGAVPIDYTLRKHVRKQRAAAPGLVWYTHAKTLVAQPKPSP